MIETKEDTVYVILYNLVVADENIIGKYPKSLDVAALSAISDKLIIRNGYLARKQSRNLPPYYATSFTDDIRDARHYLSKIDANKVAEYGISSLSGCSTAEATVIKLKRTTTLELG